MKEFAVVGSPNTGKTLFTVNFAGFLGAKTIDVTFRSYDGLLNCRHYSLPEAKRDLCSSVLHKTREIQSVILKLPVGKTSVNFKLTDTCGVTATIHEEAVVRRGMAQTLSLIRSCDFILHIVDLTAASDGNFPDAIDLEIYHYGAARGRYALLANKTDIPLARENLTKLATAFKAAKILPVSALYSQGFPAVKAYVADNL